MAYSQQWHSASELAKAFPKVPRPEDESESLIDEVGKYFDKPELWMESSNARLGGLSPNEVIAGGSDEPVRVILRQVRFIGVS